MFGTAAVVALPLGVVSGTVATLGMDVVMRRLPEGGAAPRVASGVLTDTAPDGSPERLSVFVHYFAGVGSGALYAYLALVSSVLPVGPVARTVAAAAFLYVGMVGFFVAVPLRLSRIEEKRRTTVARDWAASALVYVIVVAPVFSALTYGAAGLL